MPTECSVESFDFGTVEGRCVEAAFDAGLVTSDAGALLLGATDRAIGMMDRFAPKKLRLVGDSSLPSRPDRSAKPQYAGKTNAAGMNAIISFAR
jgi:hypothetical protein